MKLRPLALLGSLAFAAFAGGWASGTSWNPPSPSAADALLTKDTAALTKDTAAVCLPGASEASATAQAETDVADRPNEERDCLESHEVEQTRHLLGSFLIGGLLDGLAHSDELLARFEREGAAAPDVDLLVGRIASLRDQERQLTELLRTAYRSDARRERDRVTLPLFARAIAAHGEALVVAQATSAKGGRMSPSQGESYRRARQAFDDEVARVVASAADPRPARGGTGPRP